MGLGSFSTGSSATYLRIGMGVDTDRKTKEHPNGTPRAIIGKRVKEGVPGAVQVFTADGTPALDKDGKTVWRTEHAYIEGLVTKMERIRREQNGGEKEVLQMSIDTGGEVFILQLDRPLTNKENGKRAYWEDFALRMPNIDWSKPIKLQPFAIPQDDNPEYMNKFLVPYQEGKKVEKSRKVKWLKGEDAKGDIEQHMPCYVYDEDEKEWRYKKAWNWLDQHCVEVAIEKLKFLNTPHEETALDAAAQYAQTKAAQAPVAAEQNPFPMPGDDDDLTF